MAATPRYLPRLARFALRSTQCKYKYTRCFSAAARSQTDGVYQELTAMRTRTPFIEAFRKAQENKLEKPIPTEQVERDLSPKSMSHSYHKVVSPSQLIDLP